MEERVLLQKSPGKGFFPLPIYKVAFFPDFRRKLVRVLSQVSPFSQQQIKGCGFDPSGLTLQHRNPLSPAGLLRGYTHPFPRRWSCPGACPAGPFCPVLPRQRCGTRQSSTPPPLGPSGSGKGVYSPASPVFPPRPQLLMKPPLKGGKEDYQILGKKKISWEQAVSSPSWMKSLEMGWVFQTHTRLWGSRPGALKRLVVFPREGDPCGTSAPPGAPAVGLGGGERRTRPRSSACAETAAAGNEWH